MRQPVPAAPVLRLGLHLHPNDLEMRIGGGPVDAAGRPSGQFGIVRESAVGGQSSAESAVNFAYAAREPNGCAGMWMSAISSSPASDVS